jgi:hypothetical protein
MAAQFGDLVASELYCPRCQRAQPVRERLLLVLPDGELHEYCCRHCGASLGQRRVTLPPAAALSPHPRTAPRRRG